MRDIIHIGYPRTASTWFQNNLFPKVQNYTFIPRNVVKENFIHPLPGTYQKNWTHNEPEKISPFLISEEMISGKIRAGSANLHFLEIYANRIKETFNNPLIFIFLRRQPDIVYSFYNLYIKKGGTFSISEFLRQDLSLQESLLFSKWFFCYDIPLQILTKIFGREGIKIYLYEEFASNPEAFVHRFTRELNLKVDLKDINFNRINAGYTPYQRKIKHVVNKFTRQGVPFKHYYFNIPFTYGLISKGTSKESRLPGNFKRQIEEFYPEFAKSNNKLIQEYNLQEIKTFNYPL